MSKTLTKYILILIFTTFVYSSYSQNNAQIDSLLVELRSAKVDSGKVILLNELHNEYVHLDREIAVSYAREALNLSLKVKYNRGAAQSYYNIGLYYDERNNFNLSIEFVKKSLEISSKLNDTLQVAMGYYQLGKVYFYKGDYVLSLECYNKSLNLCTELNEDRGIAYNYQAIGGIYQNTGNNHIALEYYFKGFEIQKKINDKYGITFAYNNISNIYKELADFDKAIDYIEESLTISEEIKNRNGIASSYQELGLIYIETSNFEKAQAYLALSLKIFNKISNKRDAAKSYLGVGTIYDSLNIYDKAFENFNKALDLYNEIDDKSGIIQANVKLGFLYISFEDYPNAIVCLKKAEKLSRKIGNYERLIEATKGLNIIYVKQKKFREAHKYLSLNKHISDSLRKEDNIKKVTQTILQYEFGQKQKDIELKQQKRKDTFNAELKQQKLFRNISFAAFTVMVIIAFVIFGFFKIKQKANIQLSSRKREILEKNEELKQQGEEIIAQSETLQKINTELKKLSIVAQHTHNAVIIMDPLGNYEWINDSFTRIFGLTLKDLKIKIKNIIGSSTSKEVKAQINKCIQTKQTVNYEFFSEFLSDKGTWIHATLTPVLDNEGNITKLIAIDTDISELKEAEQQILQKTEEISVQKEILELQNENILENRYELAKQKEKLEQQHEDIKASIRYALTIQKSILPLKSNMDKILDYFIIYYPKDIVSGDFYWFSAIKEKDEKMESSDYTIMTVPKESDFEMHRNLKVAKDPEQQKLFVAVIDCTGHGVPGAFMSMIGSRLLNEIVNERQVFEPNQILELLNIGVRKALKQQYTENRDGMDIALCRIEKKSDGKTKIVFCGAKRPLFCYRKANEQIITLKGDRKDIGGGSWAEYQDLPFTNYAVTLKKDDMIYLTSDGMVDQNSPSGKKIGTRKLKKILQDIGHLSLSEQKKNIEEVLTNHQQTEDQRDDITVLGIRI
jgi:PAS domain S-box-containing protein